MGLGRWERQVEARTVGAGAVTMVLPTVYFRGCAGCGGLFAVPWCRRDLETGAVLSGETFPYWCRRCWARLMAGFDPEPRAVVGYIDFYSRGAYEVVARDGNRVEMRQVWSPDAAMVLASVGELMPRGF